MTLEELLAALRELLAAAEAEGRELTEEEVERAEDLEKQVAIIQRGQLVQARVAALQGTNTTMLRGVTGGAGVQTAANSGGAGLYGTARTEA